MIAFLIIFIVIVLWLQDWVLENSPQAVEVNFWPEENVVDPEDVFNIIVELKNIKSFPVYFIRMNMAFPKEFTVASQAKLTATRKLKDGQEISVSTWLKAGQSVKIKVPVSIADRGRYYLPNPVLYFGDFLGLKQKKKETLYFREVVVAPKSYGSDDVKQVLGKFIGEYSVRRFIYEDPVLTVGFREYSGREPMKMISWKQSASKQQLMVKEYDHTIEPVLSVVLNVEMTGEKSAQLIEKTYSVARSVCRNLEAKGISYGFYNNAQMLGGTGDMHSVDDGIGMHHFRKIMERMGRGMHIHAFGCDVLLHNAQKATGNERGLIIITPDTSALPALSSDGRQLILNVTDC